MKAARKIDPVDIYLGAKLRRARLERGVSQTGLGKAIGLTFQQIQKYENGSNRMSASALAKMAAELSAPISYFFKGLPDHLAERLTDQNVVQFQAKDQENTRRP